MPHSTPFIEINTHQCKACWKCVKRCPKKVLGKMHILWHKHAKVCKPTDCIGCYICVDTCKHHAIHKKENNK